MPIIELETTIAAPIAVCFDLARNIDFHQVSAGKTRERAVGGVTSGLISLGETVTFEATHFGVRQRLTSIIPAYDRPNYFRDEMVKGAFSFIRHDHRFEEKEGLTVMRDRFEFGSSLGILGRLANWLVLTNYLKRFIKERNMALKREAESNPA